MEIVLMMSFAAAVVAIRGERGDGDRGMRAATEVTAPAAPKCEDRTLVAWYGSRVALARRVTCHSLSDGGNCWPQAASAAAAWPLAARAQLRISLALLKVRSALSSLAAVTGFALGGKNGLRDELRMSRMGSRHVTWFPQGRERMDLGPKSEIPAKTTKSQAGAAIQSTQRSFELR